MTTLSTDLWVQVRQIVFGLPPLFPRTGPLGSQRCQTLDASFRQSAPCKIDNCIVGNPRTWSVIFTVDFSYVIGVFHILSKKEKRTSVTRKEMWVLHVIRSSGSSSQKLHYDITVSVHLCRVFGMTSVVVSMMSDLFASLLGKKHFGRIGDIALVCPIVWSFGSTLGCNPPSCGRVQPLTSSSLIDW